MQRFARCVGTDRLEPCCMILLRDWCRRHRSVYDRQWRLISRLRDCRQMYRRRKLLLLRRRRMVCDSHREDCQRVDHVWDSRRKKWFPLRHH